MPKLNQEGAWKVLQAEKTSAQQSKIQHVAYSIFKGPHGFEPSRNLRCPGKG